MNPNAPAMYQNKSYSFYVDISLNGVLQNTTGHTVMCYMDKGIGKTTPAVSITGVIDGTYNYRWHFTFTIANMNIPAGTYHRQVEWILPASAGEWIVRDEIVEVLKTVKS